MISSNSNYPLKYQNFDEQIPIIRKFFLPVNKRHRFVGDAVMVTLDIPAGVCGGVVDKLRGTSFST